MKCSSCQRRFRSKAAFEASERYRLLHEQLRAETGLVIATYSTTPRHFRASEHFRQHGEAAHG